MSHDSGPTAFFSKTYDEAYALLIEARNYVAYEEAGDRAALGDLSRMNVSLETMRLTTRVTEIMAWLLYQKAVFAGEMSLDEALSEDCRLDRNEVCLGGAQPEALPRRLADLMSRSQKLYLRVMRLDDMMVRDTRPPRVTDLWPGDEQS